MSLSRSDLHSYQEYSVNRIDQLPVLMLMLDCGLGKTVISLTAIDDLMFDYFMIIKVLIICPLRVCNVWKEEAENWEHLKYLKVKVCTGTEKQRLQAFQEDADIYVLNRENLEWLVDKSGIKLDFSMIILDEISSFKNHKAKRSRAFLKMRPYADRIVGLTGTPTSNGLMDLFSMYRCLDMGKRLGRFITAYRTNYFLPDKYNGNIVYSYKPREGAEEQIYDRISDITVSMKACDYLQMPELIEVNYPVTMDEKESKLYEQFRKDLVLSLAGNDITAANAAVLSGKLMQMASGCIYDDEGSAKVIHDKKLQALEDITESMCGKQFLVVYWFRFDVERIEEMFDRLSITHARINSDDNIRKWNEGGHFQVGLLNPAQAGHGVNLQKGSNTMIWYTTPHSLELVQQTNCRIFRQGQKAGTVVIQHIVTTGTIDEDILKSLSRKETTQAALIDAVKANLEEVFV